MVSGRRRRLTAGRGARQEAESFLFAHATVPLVEEGWGDGTGERVPLRRFPWDGHAAGGAAGGGGGGEDAWPRAVPRVMQTDLAPTLALLTGALIPYGSLGALVPSLLPRPGGAGGAGSGAGGAGRDAGGAVLAAHRANAQQVQAFLEAYQAATRGSLPDEVRWARLRDAGARCAAARPRRAPVACSAAGGAGARGGGVSGGAAGGRHKGRLWRGVRRCCGRRRRSRAARRAGRRARWQRTGESAPARGGPAQGRAVRGDGAGGERAGDGGGRRHLLWVARETRAAWATFDEPRMAAGVAALVAAAALAARGAARDFRATAAGRQGGWRLAGALGACAALHCAGLFRSAPPAAPPRRLRRRAHATRARLLSARRAERRSRGARQQLLHPRRAWRRPLPRPRPPLPPPARTDWTRLVPPFVLTGHVSSLLPY